MTTTRLIRYLALMCAGLEVASCAASGIPSTPSMPPSLTLGATSPFSQLDAVAGADNPAVTLPPQASTTAQPPGQPLHGCHNDKPGPVAFPTLESRPLGLPAFHTLSVRNLLQVATTTTTNPFPTNGQSRARDAKILVLSADGSEPSLASIKQVLDYQGTPYTLWIARNQPGALTADKLYDGTKGLYQGVVLADNQLSYYDGTQWASALSTNEWTTLQQYEASFGIRQVNWYTYPSPSEGFNWPSSARDTTTTPIKARYTTAGQDVFDYLNYSMPLVITKAYTYLAKPLDSTTQPLLTDGNGNALAAIHTFTDGRQSLDLTFDNNEFLTHSLALSYGLIRWVTQGVFLGERHTYMSAQIDDLFLDNDMWTVGPDAREHLNEDNEITFRMNKADLDAVVAWQDNFQKDPQTHAFKFDWAFNGFGTVDDSYAPDDLTPEVKNKQGKFKFISHTYTHPYLTDISYKDCYNELSQNLNVAKKLGFTSFSYKTLVTPNVTGLDNANALNAMKDLGVQYIVSDTSVAGQNNPSPNVGIYNPLVPSILEIPRRPTNLFYNVSKPAEWVSEYNHLYSAFWGHDVTYAELLDKESDVLLQYLLRGENDPWMFHQPDLRAYDGDRTLLTDLLDKTIAKYENIYDLPIISPTMESLGKIVANRTLYNTANVRATIIPNTSITLYTDKTCFATVQGVKSGTVEQIEGVPVSSVQVNAGTPLTITLP